MIENHQRTSTRAGNLRRAALCIAVLASLAGCGAKPDAVCDKAAELAKGAASTVDANQCAFVWEMRFETLSVFEYKSKADCAMAATSLDDLNGC